MCIFLDKRPQLFFAIELAAVALILFINSILQNHYHLSLCSLCTLQRWVLLGLGCCFAIGVLRSWKIISQRIIHGVSATLSFVGLSLALRQVWLQHYPIKSTLGTCDMDILYLFKIMPWQDVMIHVLQGGGSCSKAEWYLWNLSLAHYACLIFGGFAVVALWKLCSSLYFCRK